MSRIFDALRRSEQEAQQPPFFTAETFSDTPEKPAPPPSAGPTPAAPLLGIAKVQTHVNGSSRLSVFTEPRSLGAERFRILRTRLNQLQGTRRFRSVLITSAAPQEGKTVVTANLAIAVASQGKKVLLLEGDLRRPGVLALLALPPWPGLTAYLRGQCAALETICKVEPLGIFVAPAGEVPENPVELLQSPRLGQFLAEVRDHFDFILIDSPPIAPLADASVLKAHADACIVVVRAGVTPRPELENTIDTVGRDNIVGVVLNAAKGLERSYYGYSRYYSPEQGNGSAAKSAGRAVQKR